MPPTLFNSIATPQHASSGVQAATSPNYFALQDGSGSLLPNASPTHRHWSPPSSVVRSTAAVSPTVVPLDHNPEFDAFKRQSEGKAFKLGGLMSTPHVPVASSDRLRHRTSSSKSSATKQISDTQSILLDPASAELGRSPKRVLSPGSVSLPEAERRASPASFSCAEPEHRRSTDHSLDSQPRFAMPSRNPIVSNPCGMPKANSLPGSTKDADALLLVTPQHVHNLLESKCGQVLLLDLRVSTQYAISCINGALSLCLPTTLLKRPSFNVEKLAETFKDAGQRARFEQWQHSSYIVVYDASSTLLKDAHTCLNTIKKFRGEGYRGTPYILKGGFDEFARRFPSYIERGADASHEPGEAGPKIAPVVGGCPMPVTDKPANPFFGNIRQNMDLIGGVGQIALRHPSQATDAIEQDFPQWLRSAGEEKDQGKIVSLRFEQIEKREKKRMEDALSGDVSYGTPSYRAPAPCLQIAGIEKGNKNRYNNIWPFEHSRVRLQGVPNNGCDYINASLVKSEWSHRRYISTQAPIPATFNDFWSVVWNHDVRVLVMLTAEKEGAQIKAHNYWDKKQYGPLHLEFLTEKRVSIEPPRIHRALAKAKATATHPRRASVPLGQLDADQDDQSRERPHVIVRRFSLKHERFPFQPMREVTQLQYSHWPDFGAPAHPAHLVGLAEQCNKVVRAARTKPPGVKPPGAYEPEPAQASRPVLVHCSAGCGRTGTFCTVDSVIDMLKRQRLARRRRSDSHTSKTAHNDDDLSPSGTRGDGDGDVVNGRPSGGADDFFTSQQQQPPPPPQTSTPDEIDGRWVHRDDRDLVEKTVEDFRRQRLGMVQSLRQFVLCYESVMEWLVEQQLQPDRPAERTGSVSYSGRTVDNE